MEEVTKEAASDTVDPAKITRPRASQLLERERLIAMFDEARDRSATWVSAPPGFGKTSLASSYVEQQGLECLWYRVDADDADIGNFFHYLHRGGNRFDHRDADLPRFTAEDFPSLAAFARRFFEALYARLHIPAVLIFDDYQEIAADCVLHGLLCQAIERLPEHIQFVFLSREGPPSAFARLRAHGAFSYIGADALRFTLEEAQALAERKGAQIRAAMIPQLHALSEGWAAGLTLLLERGEPGLPQAPADVNSLQLFFDYFSQEIFAKLEPSAQELLLECALLTEMPEAAVQQLTRNESVSLFLKQLSAKNYFTTCHLGPNIVYRFHPLFRAFLSSRAETVIARERLRMLQERAADILLAMGDLEHAVELLLACEAWEKLAQTIVAHAQPLVSEGRLRTLSLWISGLPEAVVGDEPWLLFWRGFCESPFEPAAAHTALLRAYALFEATKDAAGLYLCWAAIAMLHFMAWFSSEEAVGWIATFQVLRRSHPQFPSAAIEARVALGLVALMRLYRLDHPDLAYWMGRCRTLLDAIEDASTRLMATNELAWCYSWLGKTAHGALLVRETAPLARNGAPLARISWLLASTVYAWHKADAAQCDALVNEALRLADESEVHVVDPYICVLGTYGALTVGDLGAAQKLKARIDQTPRAVSRNMDVSVFHHFYLLVSLHQGDFEDAVAHAREALAQTEHFRVLFLRFVGHVCLAACLMETATLQEAAEQLDQATGIAEGIGSPVMFHLCLLGRALLELKLQHPDQALVLLREALVQADAAGGHFTPFFCRETLSEIYALGLSAKVEVSRVREQIRRQRLIPKDPANAPDDWPWPIKIYTLGRFSVANAGRTVKISAKASRKPLLLLKALIACGGHNVRQERLIAALWPDTDGDDAHHAFETTLYRLRKLLGGESLLVKDGELTLNRKHCWVDCWTFEGLVSAISQAMDEDRPEQVEQDAARIFGLYQGPFLGLDPEIPLALAYSERLRSRLLRMIERLADYWQGHGRSDEARDCYLYALELDPRAEVFYQRLMRHYQSLRQYAEAIAVFQRCRRALHSLVALAPSPETQTLHAAIRGAAAAEEIPLVPDEG